MLLDALEDLLINFDTAYVVIDAIDESCPRDHLLKVLYNLGCETRFENLQLLVSSREYPDIETTMTKFSQPMSMAHHFIEHDIRAYVRSTLQSNSKFKHWPGMLQKQVEEVLPSRAKGM